MLAKADTGASRHYWTHRDIQGLTKVTLMIDFLIALSSRLYTKEQTRYIHHFSTKHNTLINFQK
eukprot:10642485-Ditylum_brightwellii.AAC.1